jgi:hypothetical protein
MLHILCHMLCHMTLCEQVWCVTLKPAGLMSLRSWYAWHDSLMCDTCLIGMCDMAHAYMWHDSSARHYYVQRCQRSIFQKGGREKKPRGSGVLVVGIISAHDALLLNSRIHISYFFFKFWAAYFPAFLLDVPKMVRFLTWLFWKRDLIIWGSFANEIWLF